MRAEHDAQALAALPFERVEVDGRDGLAAVDRLRTSGRGWPVVVGGDEALGRLAEQIAHGKRSPVEILEAAGRIEHPQALVAFDTAQKQRVRETVASVRPDLASDARSSAQSDDDHIADLLRSLPGLDPVEDASFLADLVARRRADPDVPDVGTWPPERPRTPGLTVAEDFQGRPLARVHLLLLPTDEGAAVPAYLDWGGWNTCPPTEYHVAALRAWRQRYGAELVGLSGDVMNLRVARRPTTRDEALALAREHYTYCNDIVDQGPGTLAPLAASLMASDWWYFWWD